MQNIVFPEVVALSDACVQCFQWGIKLLFPLCFVVLWPYPVRLLLVGLWVKGTEPIVLEPVLYLAFVFNSKRGDDAVAMNRVKI